MATGPLTGTPVTELRRSAQLARGGNSRNGPLSDARR